jgi:ubiquinone/menaquinone biosynthesis C-methylase UbiE
VIVALVPGRVIPPPKMPEFPQPVEPGRQRLAQPNVWPGMNVLLIDVHKTQFITTALQRTAPDGKVFIVSSHPVQAERLAQQFAPLGDRVEFLEAAAPAALRLSDQSIDRAFYEVKRSHPASLGPLLQELRRVFKPKAQLAVMLDFTMGGQARQAIVEACAAAGFEQVASRRHGLQRTMVFQA